LNFHNFLWADTLELPPITHASSQNQTGSGEGALVLSFWGLGTRNDSATKFSNTKMPPMMHGKHSISDVKANQMFLEGGGTTCDKEGTTFSSSPNFRTMIIINVTINTVIIQQKTCSM